LPAFCDELDAVDADLRARGFGADGADARTDAWMAEFEGAGNAAGQGREAYPAPAGSRAGRSA